MKARVNDRLADNAARGLPPGSRPFGYAHGVTADGVRTYVIVPEQADAIRWAADRVLAGWSLASVAAALAGRGIKGAHGGDLTASSVRGMLTSPTVAGKRVHRGQVTGDGNWPPILGEATWQACRARLGGPRRVTRADGKDYPVTPAHNPGTGRRYALTGLAYCGVCGAVMTGSVKQIRGGARRGGRDVPYLLCHPSKGGRACTGIMLEPAEQHVADTLFAELDKPAFLDAIAEDTHATRREEITTSLSAIDGQRADLARMWAAGDLTAAEWQAARTGLDTRERGLRAELDAKAPPPARADIAGARAAWPLMTLGERREFLRLFISRVVILPATPGLQRVDPARVEITWR